MTEPTKTVRYRVTGMDCASCAARIENDLRGKPGITDVTVSIASQELKLTVEVPLIGLQEVESTISRIGYRLARLDVQTTEVADSAEYFAHVTQSYRRALCVVVALNLGYGLVEMAGGFLAGSQALKADALDFFGDGVISAFGLIALGWRPSARAMAALSQGVFLGLLGIGVLTATAYRVLVLRQPEAELMGLFGAAALAVNVAAALVLVPHRQGGANVRAIWLFSRNDAIGNVAVIVAAMLVLWTDTPWPDLAVAAVIAALFLRSAWLIIHDARAELARVTRTPSDTLT